MDFLKMHFSISWLVVFVILLQLSSATSDANNSTAPLCTSSACIVRAGRILNALDTERPPCTDFVNFACGGIFREDQNLGLDGSKGNSGQEEGKMYDKLNKYFDDEDHEWAPDAPQMKAKQFYENCKQSWFKIPYGRELLARMALALGVPELYKKHYSDSSDIPTPPTTYGGAVRVLREQFGVRLMPTLLRTMVNGKCLHMVDYYKEDENDEDYHYIGTESDLSAIDFFNSTQELLDMRVFHTKFTELTNRYVCKQCEDLDMFSDTTLGELIEKAPEFGWAEFLNLEQNSSTVEIQSNVPDMALYLTSIWKTHTQMLKKFLIATAISKLWTRKDSGDGDSECYEMMKRYFSEITAALVLDKNKIPNVSLITRMAEQVRTALKERFNNAKWLNSDTRNIFIEKLESLRIHIGYSDVVEHSAKLYEFYSSLDQTGQLPEDHRLVAQWREHMSASRCDLDMWDQTLHTLETNALNSRNLQSVMVPLAQIRSDGYDQRIPASLNYGGIGMTIGHELMHSFDSNGRMTDRWLKSVEYEDATKDYLEKGEQCLIDYYNEIKIRGVNVLGNKTLGENIADIYGLELAYEAWREEVNTYGEDPRLPGISYTPEQLFFISFAQANCNDPNVEELKKYKSDEHAPGYARVLGSAVQSYMFKDAFQCGDVEGYDESVRCTLW